MLLESDLGGEIMTGNWEDFALGGSFVLAILAAMSMHNIKAPELATPAIAAEKPVAELVDAQTAKPAVTFTVTGKRMPKECKGEPATAEIAARCEALRDQTSVKIETSSN
jgi:hypothetical protein